MPVLFLSGLQQAVRRLLTPPLHAGSACEGLEEVRELGRQGTRPRDHDQSLGGTADTFEGTDNDVGWMSPF